MSFRIDAPAAAHKGQEVKSKPRPKPSLLAAARPMRAILPAPASVGREASTEQASKRQAFANTGKILGLCYALGVIVFPHHIEGSLSNNEICLKGDSELS